MKVKTVVLSCLMSAIVLFFVHEFSLAQPMAPVPLSKIGMVSVSRAMRECKATAAYGEKSRAETQQMAETETKLQKDVKELTDGVQVFVRGSAEFEAQYELLVRKQVELKAVQEVNKEKRIMRQQVWAEKIYREVLRITQEVAAGKGLDLVLERSEPEFPIQNADQLMMTLSTHKVLYGGGCLDITDDVIAELDKIASTLVK